MRLVIAGVSALALAAIPAALAAGATGWLGFTITARGLERSIQQEQRRAIYVAAREPPKAPMAFDMSGAGPLTVERADLDGKVLTAYLRNRTHVRQCYQELHWALKAPDGTLIAAGANYVGDPGGGVLPGDRLEAQIEVGEDRRAVALRVFATAQDACGG